MGLRRNLKPIFSWHNTKAYGLLLEKNYLSLLNGRTTSSIIQFFTLSSAGRETVHLMLVACASVLPVFSIHGISAFSMSFIETVLRPIV